MSDQNYQNPNDGWNDVPQYPSIPPQQEIPPQQPIPAQQPYTQSFEELSRLESYQEPAPQMTYSSEPLPPVPPAIPVYDPVIEERDPYATVNPDTQGFSGAPVYTTPASSYQPPAEKKNKGWMIALIVLLVLCVCLIVGIGIVMLLVASGKYEIQWSYQLFDMLAQLI